MKPKTNITFNQYLKTVAETDRLPLSDRTPVLQGLFGEVGGILSALKKEKREPESSIGLKAVIVEELGDTFWYFTCLCSRLGLDTLKIYLNLVRANRKNTKGPANRVTGALSIDLMCGPAKGGDLHEELAVLGRLTGNFLSLDYLNTDPELKVAEFLASYFSVVNHLGLTFNSIIQKNTRKVSSRFTRPPNSKLPTFDLEFPEFEQLPKHFEIEFVERAKNQQAMRWNGVFIGDPLTDAIKKSDGYRFHDVFHFAHASVLHWSPTFRALIKHKRKSKPKIDRDEDGGRAIVVEEGLSAWIFNIAKDNDYFKGQSSLTFDMLKNISNIVQGFEVEECPLVLWEEAIIKGYEVFRKVVENEGGRVICDRNQRSLSYKAR